MNNNGLIKRLGMLLMPILLVCTAGLDVAHAQTSSRSSTTTYFHTDHLGSIVAATDEGGDLVWRKTYDPYGNEITESQSGNDLEEQTYTGKPYDEETGLVYLGQRYYDPQIRRFMGMDPVGFRADTPVSFNRYAYANNNPYKFVDPDGRSSIFAVHQQGLARRLANKKITPEQYHEEKQYSPWLATTAFGGFGAFFAKTGRAWYLSNAYRVNQASIIGAEVVSGTSVAVGAAKGGANIADAARLNRSLVLDEVVDHAFVKHVLQQGEFAGLGIRTTGQFRKHVDNVLSNPSSIRYYRDGRAAYLQESTSTVVIRNPTGSGQSTAFQPRDWSNYINNVLPARSTPFQ